MINIIQKLTSGDNMEDKINEIINFINRLNNPPKWGTPDFSTLCTCSTPKQISDNDEFKPNYCYRCSRIILNM